MQVMQRRVKSENLEWSLHPAPTSTPARVPNQHGPLTQVAHLDVGRVLRICGGSFERPRSASAAYWAGFLHEKDRPCPISDPRAKPRCVMLHLRAASACRRWSGPTPPVLPELGTARDMPFSPVILSTGQVANDRLRVESNFEGDFSCAYLSLLRSHL
jgi:hypothetical protein